MFIKAVETQRVLAHKLPAALRISLRSPPGSSQELSGKRSEALGSSEKPSGALRNSPGNSRELPAELSGPLPNSEDPSAALKNSQELPETLGNFRELSGQPPGKLSGALGKS